MRETSHVCLIVYIEFTRIYVRAGSVFVCHLNFGSTISMFLQVLCILGSDPRHLNFGRILGRTIRSHLNQCQAIQEYNNKAILIWNNL